LFSNAHVARRLGIARLAAHVRADAPSSSKAVRRAIDSLDRLLVRLTIDEDQLLRIEIELTIKPDAPALQDIRPVLLQRMCGLFLNVQPRPRSQAPSALRLIFTCRSAHKRPTISSSVTSLRSSISATTNASCASSADGRRQPCGRDVSSPSFALAIQRIAVEIPTPNRAAACRADIPDADAFNTRNRRSSLSACAIIHLFTVDVESDAARYVTSHSIHRSKDLL
jgi:hypothetical protein